jgi:hypothetical protein
MRWIFQLDGAPTHISKPSMEWVENR